MTIQVPTLTRSCRCRATVRALTLASLLPSAALAHAPPQIVDIVPRTDAGPVLVTNRGLILGEAEGGPFRILCNDATRSNSADKPDVIVLPGGGLVVATSRGLIRSRDGGCSFEPVAPIGEVLVPAAAADPKDALHFWVASFDAELGGLRETSDGGETFEVVQPASEGDFIATILVSRAQPERLYIDGQLLEDRTSTSYVAVSDDGGRSFDRFEVSLLATESGFELLAVSPTDPDVIMGRAAASDPAADQDRLLVSRDSGESWESPITVSGLSEARFSADGTQAWVAGIDGAFGSADGLETFEPLPGGAVRISLPIEYGGELWLCGYYDGMHDGIGRVAAGGSTERVFAFSDVTEPVACPADSPSAVACTVLWRDWQREVLGILPDAGIPTSDAGGDAPTPDPATGAGSAAPPSEPEENRESDSGCTALGMPGRPRSAAFLVLLLLACALRARSAGDRSRLRI